MSLPKEMNYGNIKDIAESSEVHFLRFPSQNQTYTQGQELLIDISAGASGQYGFPLSSYIEGQIEVNYKTLLGASYSEAYIDGDISSVVSSYSLYHGSQQLEYTGPDICKGWQVIKDIQQNYRVNVDKSISDLRNDLPLVRPGRVIFQKAPNAGANDAIGSIIFRFCFQLPSGLLGSLSTKALPLSRINSRLQLKLQLQSAIKAFVGVNAEVYNYTLSNIYYNIKVCKLPQELDLALMRAMPTVMIPATAIKIDSIGLNSGASSFRFPLNFNFSSVKSLFFFFQNQESANGTYITKCISNNRKHCLVKEYSLDINGIKFPSTGISGDPSITFNEIRKAWDCMSDAYHSSSFTVDNFESISLADDPDTVGLDAAGDDLNTYKSVFAIDLDRFNHSSDLLIAGTSFINKSININGVFGTNLTDNVTMYAMVIYDTSYTIDQAGQVSLRA